MPVNLWDYQLFEDDKIEMLERCVDLLKDRGDVLDLSYAQGVVATTEELIKTVKESKERADYLYSGLSEVFYALNKWVGHDTAEDSFKKAVEKYMARKHPQA